MLKFCFAVLLVTNAALFAYGQGILGSFQGEEHEPARLQKQLNARQLTLISAEKANAANGANAATAPAAPDAAPAARAEDKPVVACLEVGNFVLADARRFEAQLAPLALGDRQARRNVPGQEISSYMVMIPPAPTRDVAEKRAAELRAKGVADFYIVPDGQQKNGISLGVFKAETAAQTALAKLVKQGVTTARVAPRYSASKQMVFQFRDITAATRASLERIAAKFPEQQVRGCR
ncbi:SPOR domain-containing protein [Pseudoduganella chitinolytica]|uniref:SPOR domain-containing protein n=1 Tax=Pseudoduganella chitinolytica TaxID=34070 RepID=A0ABY8B582_9BURK|nr:SPOR domain-containing protein [Pseudoduganella chitinolytica]WEF31110.1 SPOR domain-containing protein [Pseudoduganella chitinolytica]